MSDTTHQGTTSAQDFEPEVRARLTQKERFFLKGADGILHSTVWADVPAGTDVTAVFERRQAMYLVKAQTPRGELYRRIWPSFLRLL
jgi:hypothetical protein